MAFEIPSSFLVESLLLPLSLAGMGGTISEYRAEGCPVEAASAISLPPVRDRCHAISNLAAIVLLFVSFVPLPVSLWLPFGIAWCHRKSSGFPLSCCTALVGALDQPVT